MGHYTKFHLRVKLAFDLPEDIRILLRKQCQPYEAAFVEYMEKNKDTPVSQVEQEFRWAEWQGLNYSPAHPFFTLERADMIPWGRNGEDYPDPVYEQYLDGSSKLIFTCELKNYHQEIQNFLEWLAPYIRLKYGKRNRGRQKTWIGYCQPESERGRIDYYVKAVPTVAHPSMLYGRSIEDDYQNIRHY